MKKKAIKIKVPIKDLSESSKTLLALIMSTVWKKDRKEQKQFDVETSKAIGKRVLHVVEEYIEDVAEKMNEQGLFNEKEKDDA